MMGQHMYICMSRMPRVKYIIEKEKNVGTFKCHICL